MEKNKIPTAPLLEIIFDGRNKEYGAYELRTQYNKRLTVALASTVSLSLVVFFSSFILSGDRDSVRRLKDPGDMHFTKVEPIKDDPIVIPPKPKQIQTVATVRHVTYRIVKNEEVKENEKPPELDQLEKAIISTTTNPGDIPDGPVAPPVLLGGVVDVPKSKDDGAPFIKVEKEAEFPGGNSAWSKYLSREVNRNIDELQDEGRSGTVLVLFIVDSKGIVSDVRALPCSEAGVNNCLGADAKLAEIAVNAIRKGPKWIPALQNGEHVKAYRRQAVTFQLEEE